jgi:hypothetical protein
VCVFVLSSLDNDGAFWKIQVENVFALEKDTGLGRTYVSRASVSLDFT